MSSVEIAGSVALVTGANRGIGRAIVQALLDRGAAKVYAGARNPSSLDSLVEQYPDRVVPVELDVTSQANIDAVASLANDVNILVNNAGVAGNGGMAITDPSINPYSRTEFDVNVFGLLSTTQALTGALRTNGRSAVVNVGSLASLVNFPMFQSYSVSKAAVHSITQALRVALPDTLVVGVYPGPVDTDMAAGIEMDKETPAAVADAILDGIEAGEEEVFPDPMSKQMGDLYGADPKELERQIAALAEA